MTAPDQAPTAVSRPKIFGEGAIVRAMCENAVSILKQRRLITFGAQLISASNSGDGTILIHVQAAGITIKSVFGSLLALESFYTRQATEDRDSTV